MEVENLVQVFLVDMECDSCPEGWMITTFNPKEHFEHKCNKCGHLAVYEGKMYPKVVYRSPDGQEIGTLK